MKADDKARDLLTALLQMSAPELESFLRHLSVEELQGFVGTFASNLGEKIKTLPRRPTTPKAKRLLSRYDVGIDE
jgi:hypothetical protein